MSNKVITASAGTGKTYRLSVEYIKCLLEMFEKGGDENCFRHILVITFTRKATAEIRSRVFKQLKDLLKRKHESDVYGTLSELLKHELSNDEFVWLEKVYHNMCVNRHKIQ
ncbi:MAG: UvrD-helicase domain-containing protein, partial [Spirochaetales bacterium]|nr:UvrD-helicase domain-containing protein [Spirochaetales bacterium]